MSVNEPFGGTLVLADTSAWLRASRPEVASMWAQALLGGQIVISPVIELELSFGARNATEMLALQEDLGFMRELPLTHSTARAALSGMRELASRQAGYHRVPPPDFLIAASAEAAGVGVLHYDHHFDRLAEVFEIDSRWIAPPGALA